jgi:HlyD family secretion protein
MDPTNSARKSDQEDYDNKKQDYYEAVYKRDLYINDLDRAKADVEAAQGKVDDARREYDKKQTGPDTEKLTLAQASLDQTKAQVASAQRAVDDAALTAPYDGTVVDLYHLTNGAFISPGTPAAQIADFSAWYVETKDLTELDIVKVQAGDPVNLTADALPGVTFSGTVESIKQVYGEYSDDIVYTVRIKLNTPPADLKWGMTVDAQFGKASK